MYEKITKKITKRKIQIVLGVLWIIDGFLQLQPKMLTPEFVKKVILPVSHGQPFWVSDPVHTMAHIVLMHPALFDICFGLAQLIIGTLILWRKTTSYGLVISVVWSLLVWYFAEGLGGLATGHTLLITGAPGAALLYAILAIGVFPSKQPGRDSSVYPAAWLLFVWAVLWIGGAQLQLLRGQDTTKGIAVTIQGMARGAPDWLRTIDLWTYSKFVHVGNWFVVILMFLQLAIGGVAFISKSWRFWGVFAGIVLSFVFWIVGQGLGSYYSGLATDLNTAPLIILLGISLLGLKRSKYDFS